MKTGHMTDKDVRNRSGAAAHVAVTDGNPHGVDLDDMDVVGLYGESPPAVTSFLFGETSGGGARRFVAGHFTRDADFGSHAILRSTAIMGAPATVTIAQNCFVGRRTGNIESITRAEQGDLLRIPLVKYYTSGPVNLNASTTYADLDFDNEELTQGETDGFFSHDTSTNPDEITCNFDGVVEASFNVPMTSTAQRPNVKYRFTVNGSAQRTEFKTGYIRASTTTHNESSCGGTESFAVSDTDIITLQHARESVVGTVTVSPASGAIIQIKKVG